MCKNVTGVSANDIIAGVLKCCTGVEKQCVGCAEMLHGPTPA